MIATLLSGAYLPFSLSLGLLFGLLAVEIVALVLGGSLMSADDAMPDMADPTFDLPTDAEPDVAALLAASDTADAAPAADGGTALSLLGLGRVPFAIWLAALLLGFGLGGMAVQTVAEGVAGSALPGWLAAVAAVVPGLLVARGAAGLLGGLVKPNETTATGPQFMGGLRGVVTQGTARRDSPAEVRLRDRHGNIHYLRCEPFRDTDVIPEGTEVLTLRERKAGGGWGLRILPILH